MGTNYYLRLTYCSHCGAKLDHLETNTDRLTHLGKASGGWKFTFAGSDTVKNYTQWLAQITPQHCIIDEYGQEFTLDQFIKIIFGLQQNETQYCFGREQGFWLDEKGYCFCGMQGFC